MFKTSLLIGTMLASNLAGVCCASAMPVPVHHHGMMMSAGYFNDDQLEVEAPAAHCRSEAAQNVSFIERDLDRGSDTNQYLCRGMNVTLIDYSPFHSIPSFDQISPQRFFFHGCGFHGISPPRVLEQSSGNQLLF